MFGKKLIAYETSGTRTDIVDNIIQQIAKKDSNVAYALNTTIIDGDVVKQSYSVGHTEALRVWASDFLGYEIKPVTP